MNYYYDCEFLEGKQDKTILGIKYGETKPTIDLISIAFVSEDNRKYYAISKDFNLKEAWNRHDKKVNMDYNPSREESHYNPMFIKEYWIRENVLKPIYKELHDKENLNARKAHYRCNVYIKKTEYNFTYKDLKRLINKYGKTNKQITEEVVKFVNPDLDKLKTELTGRIFDTEINENSIKWNKFILDHNVHLDKFPNTSNIYCQPKFYGYYSAYDHVVFCWLFGKMIDLPKGFPMYTVDLQQTLDQQEERNSYGGKLQDHPNYPKQTNEHSAIHDARWNKQLHEFLKSI